MKKKKPSSLNQEHINILQTMENLLQDTDETFSQSCMRYGEIPDDELLIPMQETLWAFCEDNPKMKKEEFATWYQGLIEDEDLFRLDKQTPEVLKDVRFLFDEKTNDWIAKGLLVPDNDTNYAFLGIIGMAIYSIYHILMEKYAQLNNGAFFKNSMFGKYKIIALEYADNCTLNDFQNPRSYNRYDKEALFIYAMGGFDGYEDYQRTLDIYNEVKSVVYRDPDRLLGEIKKELEQLAQSSKEKKIQYAFLYACAVIDYWLNNKKC